MSTSTVAKQFKDLKKKLYEIISAGANNPKSTRVKSEISQYLRVDDNFKSDKPLIIIQNAQINSKVVCNTTEALQIIDDIEMGLLGSGTLDSLLNAYLDQGYTWPEIKDLIQSTYFTIAEQRTSTSAAAAKILGVGRTTIPEFKARLKKKRLECIQESDDDIIEI